MNRVALLLRKDALVLRRSPLLLGILLAYPAAIAVLVGLVASYASSKPRVALVDEDGLPPTVEIAGKRFHVDRTIRQVSQNVTLVRLSPEAAEHQLRTGKVVAVVTVPPGFIATLKGMVQSPRLELQLSRGTISSRVEQQVQALVYSLNRQLQRAYIGNNLQYVTLILHGGNGSFLGRRFNILGLERAERVLGRMPRTDDVERLQDFIHDARLALANTDDALRATANPIELVRAPERGRTWVLSAEVQAYALGLTITFLALMLAAGSLAAERDENVVGRLARGLVGLGHLVWAKVALAAGVALVLGVAIALAFGVIIEIGGVTGGEPWRRLPLLVLGLLLAGGALGALGALLGALAREARAASLVAVLVVLPIVFLGLIPSEVVPPAGWVSDGLPFAHAVRFFSSALYDLSPWGEVLRQGLWLVALGLVFVGLARVAARRLLA
ncbi:MAG TPA: ABC transporter permease [Gaiellaceae bacterium]|nr:ABC transporter permease [Gaiellaceae bacterium]